MFGLLLLTTSHSQSGDVFGNPAPVFWWIAGIVAVLGLIADLAGGGNLFLALALLVGEVFISGVGGIFLGWVIAGVVCAILGWSPQGLIWWAWLTAFAFLRIMWHLNPETRKGY